jgi:hypothetical protein
MAAGRNRPLLLGAEDSEGKQFEVVTKFRGREMDARSQTVELITAQLADDLGIDVPKAAVVDVPAGFQTIIQNPDDASMVSGSIGVNFGSVHLGPRFTTWPPGRAPHGNQRDRAAAIFAFDTLIQNPDRRADNPNLWALSDRLGVYDHEQAFSFLFLPIIGGAPRPWIPSDQAAAFAFLANHIFFPALRGSNFDLNSFESRLETLTDQDVDAYVQSVPEEWRVENTLSEDIASYILEARQERTRLLGFVKHTLR